MEKIFDKLPASQKEAILRALLLALNWRGWDSECDCHACQYIRDIAKILENNGYHMSEYT